MSYVSKGRITIQSVEFDSSIAKINYTFEKAYKLFERKHKALCVIEMPINDYYFHFNTLEEMIRKELLDMIVNEYDVLTLKEAMRVDIDKLDFL